MNNGTRELEQLGSGYRGLRGVIRREFPEFLPWLREKVITRKNQIDYAQGSGKDIYIHLGMGSNTAVVVYLSRLQDWLHTNAFIFFGEKEETTTVRNLVDAFSRKEGYKVPQRGKLLRGVFQRGNQSADASLQIPQREF